jgi:hypothetical protein
VAGRLAESIQRLIDNLEGIGRKRKSDVAPSTNRKRKKEERAEEGKGMDKEKTSKRAGYMRGDIFSYPPSFYVGTR